MKQRLLQRGMNMANRGAWVIGQELAQDAFLQTVREAGFDHVRFPFPFSDKREETRPGERYYAVIREVCEMALRHDLTPVVDIHPFYAINSAPDTYGPAFLQMWEELAAYLGDADERIVFELLNEPSDQLDYQRLNDLQNEAIRRIRRTNPTRMLVAACAHCNTIENLHHLRLPEEDRHIVVAIHDYTPMTFTHQGADWCRPPFPADVPWKATAEERQVPIDHLDMAKAWADEHDRFLWMGEFGVFQRADMEDRCRWTRYMVRLCEERGFGWAYWEFYSGFGAYDADEGTWRRPLLEALLPAAAVPQARAI